MLVIAMQYVQFIQGTTLWFVHLENLANLFSFFKGRVNFLPSFIIREPFSAYYYIF